ncbi:MAG TPA: hypothetical protein VFC09_08250 [Candidatus Dormibacteraeota bacterium]|nr:hypothetical protein [Candidatus Dormibacteraeota bacterium]
MNRARRAAALLPLLCALAACGPSTSIDANLNGQPANVLLGGSLPSPTAVAALPNLNPMATFPGFLQPPPPVSYPHAVALPSISFATPNPCPPADPRAPAQVALSSQPEAPPANGSYHFHQSGQVQYTAPAKSVVPAAPDVVRTVQSTPMTAQGTFTYQTSETEGTVTQVTKFLVDPAGVDVASAAAAEGAGLYLTEIDGYAPTGNDQFVPQNPVQLLAFPAAAQVGTTFNVDGVDGTHELALKGTGTVVGAGRVDACGSVIYAYQVTLSAELIGPSSDVGLDAAYWIAPQYGAISVQDSVTWATKPSNPTQYTSTIEATISELPGGAEQ